jgi:hypothetical protein
LIPGSLSCRSLHTHQRPCACSCQKEPSGCMFHKSSQRWYAEKEYIYEYDDYTGLCQVLLTLRPLETFPAADQRSGAVRAAHAHLQSVARCCPFVSCCKKPNSRAGREQRRWPSRRERSHHALLLSERVTSPEEHHHSRRRKGHEEPGQHCLTVRPPAGSTELPGHNGCFPAQKLCRSVL